MAFNPKSDDDRARAITRLVDGSISDSERPAITDWAASQPDVSSQVAAQRRVAGLLGTAGPAVPPDLLEHVRARVQATDRADGSQRAGRPRGFWRGGLVAGAVAAVAAAVVAIVIGTAGGGNGPTIAAAARLAGSRATTPAPPASSSTLLDVSYGGVTFPNYQAQFGAVATGQRFDKIDGRPALTVFYRLHDGTRLSYTVFSGKPVPLPGGNVRTVVYNGVPIRTFSTSPGLSVATLVRFGRTCVLAASAARDTVLGLAEAPLRQHV